MLTKQELKQTLLMALKTSKSLFSVMTPIIILAKVLTEWDLIHLVSLPLKPFIEGLHLPSETGLVWLSTMLNNIYGGLIMFSSIEVPPLSVAQATTLSLLMLVGHNLFVEVAVASRCGVRAPFNFAFRFGSALLFAFIISHFYQEFSLFTQNSTPSIHFEPSSLTLLDWALAESMKLLSIFFIILSLFILVKLLTKWGLVNKMNQALAPLMHLVGINKKASLITVVGLCLGFAYGSGLIIEEVDTGQIDKSDAFFSISLMGLSHALIEDTLLVYLLGSDFFGIFIFRIVFSFIVVFLLVRITQKISPKWQERIFWK